jgi:hypothetical protein
VKLEIWVQGNKRRSTLVHLLEKARQDSEKKSLETWYSKNWYQWTVFKVEVTAKRANVWLNLVLSSRLRQMLIKHNCRPNFIKFRQIKQTRVTSKEKIRIYILKSFLNNRRFMDLDNMLRWAHHWKEPRFNYREISSMSMSRKSHSKFLKTM